MKTMMKTYELVFCVITGPLRYIRIKYRCKSLNDAIAHAATVTPAGYELLGIIHMGEWVYNP